MTNVSLIDPYKAPPWINDNDDADDPNPVYFLSVSGVGDELPQTVFNKKNLIIVSILICSLVVFPFDVTVNKYFPFSDLNHS